MTITVYWRPGCGFCHGLMRGLRRQDVAFDRVDIWEDEDAAAFVRSVTGGAETVPTVTYEPPEPGRFARLLTRLLGG